MNYVKTFGLMALMTALFVAVAGWFGGRSAMLIALAFAAIVNPLRTGGLSGLFRTHPPTEERVRRLEEIARRGV